MRLPSVSTSSAVRSEISRRWTTSRPRKISASRSPTAIGPIVSLMPNCVTMRRAISVACWMSCAAPVVTFSGPNTSSSATRLAMAYDDVLLGVVVPVDDVLLGVVVPVLFREREGDAERAAARHDRDLMERVETGDFEADERVACLEVPGLDPRSEEHTSELQSQSNLVCRLLLEKKKKKKTYALHLQPAYQRNKRKNHHNHCTTESKPHDPA